MDERVLNAALAGLLYDVQSFGNLANAKVNVQEFWAQLNANNLDEVILAASGLATGQSQVSRIKSLKQLQSVFCGITLNGSTPPSPRFHLLTPLTLTRGDSTEKYSRIFPGEKSPEAEIQQDYKTLWSGAQASGQGFAAEIDLLLKIGASTETLVESLLLLMQRYAWCIRAADNLPDVNLYDYARLTAALTACSLDRSGQIPTGDQGGGSVALLVGGDMSGIQDFIYTLTSRGAASALRGRSLYLQLLTEAVARFVLRELQLPMTNLIQLGGGHFYILARPSDAADFLRLRQRISQILLAFHSGELYLALDGIPLTAEDFQGKNLPQRWQSLGEQLRQIKARKFSELGADMFSWIFETSRDRGDEELACQVCGREHIGTRRGNNDEQKPRKCPPCEAYEALGNQLREANYQLIDEVNPSSIPDPNSPVGNWGAALRCFGFVAQFGKTRPASDPATIRTVVLALNDNALDSIRPDRTIAVGRRFLVNVTPVFTSEDRAAILKDHLIPEPELPPTDSVKPFDVMEKQAHGFRRVGVLRMDVDGMGKMISKGFGEHATLARLTALSSMISLFFEGWTAELARQYNRAGGAASDRVYSIYSGGDDLFFVGSWDAMPELALAIRNDLSKFTAQHPAIHASAGIALISGKYPLYQAAHDAKAALDRSKNRSGKNAITFLEQTIDWNRFADEVVPMKDRLQTLIDNEENRLPQSLLQRLQQFQLQYVQKQKEAQDRGEAENKEGHEQVYWGPWNWRSAYFLKRLAEQRKIKGDPKVSEAIEELRATLSHDKFTAIEWIGLAARWVTLLIRGS